MHRCAETDIACLHVNGCFCAGCIGLQARSEKERSDSMPGYGEKAEKAQARSEKERSGFELDMARKPKGRGPAANPNEGGKRWLKSRLLLPVWS